MSCPPSRQSPRPAFPASRLFRKRPLWPALVGMMTIAAAALWGAVCGTAVAAVEFTMVRSAGNPDRMTGPPSSQLLTGADGNLYGTTRHGGAAGKGALYRYEPGTGKFQVLTAFPDPAPISVPVSPVIEGSDGVLYGTTEQPRPAVYGYDRSTGELRVVTLTDLEPGYQCRAGVIEGSDGLLYGVAVRVENIFGSFIAREGVFYRVGKNGEDFRILRRVTQADDKLAHFHYPLTETADGSLVAVASEMAGQYERGALVRMDRDGSAFRVLYNFGATPEDPVIPFGGLLASADGYFYGTLHSGGITAGAVYRIRPDGTDFSVVHGFTQPGLGSPFGTLVEGPDGALYGNTRLWQERTGRAFTVKKDGTGYRVLGTRTAEYDSFTGLALAGDGNLYGVNAQSGDPGSMGIIYRLTTQGAGETAVHRLSQGGGDGPPDRLLEGLDKWFYGVSSTYSAAGGQPVFYKVRRDGSGYTELRRFEPFSVQGGMRAPTARLVQAPDGYIYSVALEGGTRGGGAVIRLSPDGSYSYVVQFNSYEAVSGPANPVGVELASDGRLYGISIYGGQNNDATIFSVATNGTGLRIVRSLNTPFGASWSPPKEGRDGRLYGRYAEGIYSLNKNGGDFRQHLIFTPNGLVPPSGGGGIIEGSDGWLYGFQTEGGRTTGNGGCLYKVRADGTELTKLHTFRGETRDPSGPGPSLLEGTDGYLYGLNNLAIYRIRKDGTGLENLHLFSFVIPNLPQPQDLFRSPDGNLYGVVRQGGTLGFGGVFRYGEAPEIAAEAPAGTAVESGAGTLDFGQSVSGDPPTDLTALLRNTGNKDLTLTGLTLTGEGAEDFLLENAEPGALAPGATRSVTVRFTPRFAAARALTLTVTSDDYDEPAFTFAVRAETLAPLLRVRETDSAGAEVTSGQSAVVSFGETPQGTPVTRRFLLSNEGNGPLRPGAVTVPAGFSFALPSGEVPAGGTAFLEVTLLAAQYGTYGGTVTLASNAPARPVFEFPVGGTALAADITLRNGAAPDSPELPSGAGSVVDFGRAIQGTPARRVFTIGNTGNAPLLIRSVTAPAGYTVDRDFTTPLTVPAGGNAPLGISMTGLEPGVLTGAVTVSSDDPDEAVYVFTVTGEVYIPAPVATLPTAATTLNRQTGLREQTVRLTNDTTATVPGALLLIRGLPPGVTVANAAAVRPDGTVEVRVSGPMAPRTMLDVVLEYASATRFPGEIRPVVEVTVLSESGDPAAGSAAGTLAIERLAPLPDGGMLLEFSSRAGALYEVQYSPDGASWSVSPASVRAGGNRCQWIDRGPPRTESPPSASARRFYRVRELAP